MNIQVDYDPTFALYTATDAETYDPDPGSIGDVVGRGRTEREAINNLVDQLLANEYDFGLADGKKPQREAA